MAFGLLLLVSLGYGVYAGFLQLDGNFHPVIAGELYRSAQPTKERLFTYERLYGIRTVLNLRGENDGSPWYDDEVEASRELGIKHIDFRMSARRKLNEDQAAQLVALMRDAPKPLLIHCSSGADRSGLASALFMAAVAGKSEYTAESQLSFRYGHVGIPFLSSSFAMDDAFEDLEPWLGFDGS